MPDTAPAPTQTAAPAAPSPAPTPSTPAPAETAPAITVAPAPSRPEPRVVSLKDFLGRSGKKSTVADVLKKPPEPAKKTATPAPKPKDPVTGKFVKANPAQGIAPEPEPTLEPTPEPVPPAKIKIGNEEKTAEEWESHYKALREAAEARKAEPPAPAEPKIELPTKTDAELDQEFIDAYSNEIGLTEEEFDQALASGNPAPIRAKIAKAALDTRKWVAEHLTKLRHDLDEMKPAIEMAEKVKSFEADQAFNTAFPDIAKHPEGAKVKAEVKSALEDHASYLMWKKEQGKATAEDDAFLKLHSEDPAQLIGFNTKKRLGIDSNGTTPPPAAAAPAPAKPTGPLPPTGQRPGGGQAPQVISAQQAARERLRNIR